MAEKECVTMGLDDDDTAAPELTCYGTATLRDDDGVPYCRKHHCRMKAVSSGPKGSRKTYYRCQVDGCNESGVMVRQAKRVPNEPQKCPHCEKAGRTTYCERDGDLVRAGSKKRRQPGMVVLVCPVCEWMAPALADPRMAGFAMNAASYGDR